jgi:hypothetical protein
MKDSKPVPSSKPNDVTATEAADCQSYEPPRILKAVEVGHPSRREFVMASLAAVAAGCNSAASITTVNGVCSCHAVCTCDAEGSSGGQSVTQSKYDSSGTCICDTVCSCNTVCTCNSQGGGGGGGDYWY